MAQFLSAVGTQGEIPLQFKEPRYISFNPTNNKVYVTDNGSKHVQVLNSDLSFSSTFGRRTFDFVHEIACDSIGNMYTPDFGKHFGEFKHASGVAVDNSGIVYVCDANDDCIHTFLLKHFY